MTEPRQDIPLEARQEARKGGFARWIPLIVTLAALGFVLMSGVHGYLSLERLVEGRERLEALVAAHPVGSVALFAGLYVTVVALSIPATAFLGIVGGFLFGWPLGTAVAAASATAGGTILFLTIRTAFGDLLTRRADSRVGKLASGFRSGAFGYLVFLRLMPVVPFWVTTWSAAFFGVRLRTFFLATLVGIVPPCLGFTLAGSGLDETVNARQDAYKACLAAGGDDCRFVFSVSDLVTPELFLALLLLALLALVPVVIRWWRHRRNKIGRIKIGRIKIEGEPPP